MAPSLQPSPDMVRSKLGKKCRSLTEFFEVEAVIEVITPQKTHILKHIHKLVWQLFAVKVCLNFRVKSLN